MIDQAESLSIVKTEEEITTDLLNKFETIPLVDKYEAYEIFHTGYEQISGDLEIIQSEGWDAARQVDPNMVLKRKMGEKQKCRRDGKDIYCLLRWYRKYCWLMNWVGWNRKIKDAGNSG